MGKDGSVFNFGEKYRWQITDIPTDAKSVGFRVIPYVTNTSSDTFWGSTFTYENSDGTYTLPWSE